MKGIITLVIGILSIIVGALSIIDAYRNKENISEKVWGLEKGAFSVKDKEKFKKIMLRKTVVIGIVFILLGVLITLTEDNISLLIFPMVINIFFDKYSRKYLIIHNIH